MRIIVTGAAGMLGSALVPELVQARHEVVATDIDLRVIRPWGPSGPTLCPLDVRSATQVLDAVEQIRPDLVVHLAAETDVEVCERDVDHALLTNTLGTKFVALACQRLGVAMAYVSTAGVFNGEKNTPYTEIDEPDPINVYGVTKLEGERIVQSLLHSHYVVRAGWMTGGGPGKDHKFVSLIIDQLAAGKKVLHAVGDKLGTPTYNQDFARTFVELIATASYGLYHIAGTGRGTRYDVARCILDVLGRDDVELVEVDSGFFEERYWAPRPRSEIMANKILELQGMDTMRPWPVALEEYLHGAYAGWSNGQARLPSSNAYRSTDAARTARGRLLGTTAGRSGRREELPAGSVS